MGSGQDTVRHNLVIVTSVVLLIATAVISAAAEAALPSVKSSDIVPISVKDLIFATLSTEDQRRKEEFNRDLPLKIDDYTTLQRVDHKGGYWVFHFIVTYFIKRNSVKEFEEKKHATTLSSLCMDKSFVQSLKESGPFLYQYLDPSGQTGDVMIPKDDCGE